MIKDKKYSFPKEWSLEPFHLISSMNGRIGWQGLKQSEFTQKSDDPYLITGMNFKDGKIRWDEVYHIPKKRYAEAKNIQLKEHDVLITKDGTIGKVLFVDKIPYPHKASLNSHLLVFRPIGEKYVSKFLFYQLQSKPFLDYIEENKSGSTFFGITQGAIGKYPVFLPLIPEQESISKSLSDVDELIDSLGKLIEKKKNIKQGTMQELLTGKRRSSERKTDYKQTEIGMIPEDWEIKKVGNFVDIKNGYAFKGEFFTDKPNENIVLTPVNFNIGGGFKTEKFKYTIEMYADEYILKDGDIIVTMTDLSKDGDTLGYPAKIPCKTRKKFLHNQRLGLLTFKSKISKNFIYWVLRTKRYHIFVIGSATGSTVKHTSPDRIKQHLFALPLDYSEQEQIATVLSNMDSEIEELEKNKNKYIMIKNGMMQKLLTGEIRLK